MASSATMVTAPIVFCSRRLPNLKRAETRPMSHAMGGPMTSKNNAKRQFM